MKIPSNAQYLDDNGRGAQGELDLTRLSKAPKGMKKWKKVAPVKGHLIIGHSETGHNHVLSAQDAVVYQDPKDGFKLYAEIKNDTALMHLRNFDTHRPIAFEKGDVVEVRAGREFRNQQVQRAAD